MDLALGLEGDGFSDHRCRKYAADNDPRKENFSTLEQHRRCTGKATPQDTSASNLQHLQTVVK